MAAMAWVGCGGGLVRRPEAGTAPPWLEPGPVPVSPTPAASRADSSGTGGLTSADSLLAAMSSATPAGPAQVAGATGRRPPSRRPSLVETLIGAAPDDAAAARADRQPADPRRVRREINEYAWWCVDQGLWNEARAHLERAVVADSLAASLHNNLAVVYEHFGLHEQAALHYQRAAELNPRSRVCTANYERLQQQRQASTDTLSQSDRGPGRERRDGPPPRQPAVDPALTSGD
jgi:hypothetical protein